MNFESVSLPSISIFSNLLKFVSVDNADIPRGEQPRRAIKTGETSLLMSLPTFLLWWFHLLQIF